MQLFSVLLGLGALAGLLLVGWRAPKKEPIRYLDAAVFVLFAALVGGRALTVSVNWGYYATHLSEIVKVWLGGLSGIGALVGGVLGVIIISMWWRLPAGILADTIFPLAGALSISSWLGCWADTCAYGLPSKAWWALPARDEWGVLASRIPVQLVGAALTLILVWTIDRSKRLALPGLSAGIGLFGLSLIMFALSYLRADPVPIWQGLRLEAWGSIGLMIFSACIVVVLLVRWRLKKTAYPREKGYGMGK